MARTSVAGGVHCLGKRGQPPRVCDGFVMQSVRPQRQASTAAAKGAMPQYFSAMSNLASRHALPSVVLAKQLATASWIAA